MPRAPKAAEPFAPVPALLHAFDVNERLNQYLLENLPAEAWSATPPGGRGRTVGGMAAHVHNVRVMWLQAAARDVPGPPKLDGDSPTVKDVRGALKASHAALRSLLERALLGDGQVKGFKPDAVAFFSYLLAHDAHHRGQISMLARQVGHPLPRSAGFGLWEWGSRGREL